MFLTEQLPQCYRNATSLPLEVIKRDTVAQKDWRWLECEEGQVGVSRKCRERQDGAGLGMARTSTMLLMTIGSMLSGKRSRLKRARDTKAF